MRGDPSSIEGLKKRKGPASLSDLSRLQNEEEGVEMLGLMNV